ncbi:hypothetical protein BMW26_07845 [Microbacterium sp. 1.5R]|uniref:hypothetical protein n=1 Tax=Microbacterium sp. 1.5R TaxID=1916917 RepID=UPI00090C4035|nr:hypothetical protein [Microbacterium sp. 1.5R]APH44878.1 hypothetical protein BMW26_07845 [Microbacterium sp. 1.5R]
MTTWYSATTPEQADRLLAAWPDAPTENQELCGFLLDIAREQVLEFAPPYPGLDSSERWEHMAAWDLDPAPRFVYAQLQQATNLWNAGRAQQDSSVGSEGYSFTPRPLDKTIRSIIRPTSGVANVF